MPPTSSLYGRAVVDFVHDMAAGAFPGAVLAAWMIRRQVEGASPDAVDVLEKASVSLWLILAVVLVAIIATGAIRLDYWQLTIRPESLASKTRMVLVKHTAFVLITIGSIALTFTLLPG